ncbi:SSI family serine proteinase inhibitor [Streptomyces sp. NPDC000410]|uniref:SSI family serine proteinase inhibitor n=1 Tax=Streptomyces sp. NPDC000410 TaxID=3154254 RepID=UPI003317A3AC
MLRRIALTLAATATATVAVAAPSSASDPAPDPTPRPAPASVLGLLPLPVPLLETPDRLTVTTTNTGDPKADGAYELTCGPAGGTHPEAAAACARLEELGEGGKDPFAPVEPGTMCTFQYGGPAKARISGTWRGRSVDATFDRGDGCEIKRWQSLEPVLPTSRS